MVTFFSSFFFFFFFLEVTIMDQILDVLQSSTQKICFRPKIGIYLCPALQ